ncbi:MAG: AsmA-like C-terminal region-containing protein [Pseudomonadales bacterium]
MKRFFLYGIITTLLGVLAFMLVQPGLLKWSAGKLLQQADIELVSVDELTLTPGATTTLTARELVLEHADASVQIGELQIALVTTSMFSPGRPELSLIQASNWQASLRPRLHGTRNNSDQPEGLDSLLAQLDGLLIQLDHPLYAIKRLNLLKGDLNYRDDDQEISLVTESMAADQYGQGINLTVRGILNRSRLDFDVRLERHENKTELTGHGQWQDHQLSLQTEVSSLKPLTGLSAELLLAAPDARPMLELLGAQEVRNGQLQVRATLTGSNDELLSASKLQIGELRFDSDLTLQLASRDFVLAFFAAGPSLQEAGALLDYLEYTNEPFEVSGRITKAGSEVKLQDGNIQLGPGYFAATGELPNYPSITDWQFELAAERFDLSILQPFVACHLPELDLDWQGRFATNEQAQEVAEIRITDQNGQSIEANGVFGAYPDFIGTEITLSANQIQSELITHCVDLELAEALALNANGKISKPNNHWQLDSLELDINSLELDTNSLEQNAPQLLPLATLKAHANNSDSLTVDLSTADAARLSQLVENFPVQLNAIAASISSEITLRPNPAMVAPRIRLGNSEGEFHISENDAGDIVAMLDLRGPDLTHIIADTPLNRAQSRLPFTVQANLELGQRRMLQTDLSVQLDDNNIKVKTHIDLDDLTDSPTLAIHGSGPDLETMFGPFLQHPLPNEPFDVAFNLKQSNAQTEIDQLELNVGPHALTGSLMLDALPNLERTRGKVSLTSPGVVRLLKLFGFTPSILDVPVNIELELDGTRDLVSARILQAQIGRSSISGEITMKPGDIHQVTVDLKSPLLHLPTFLPSLETATDDKKDAIARGKQVIPDLQIPWSLLTKVDLDFQWDGAEVILRTDQTAQATVAFSSANGQLRSDNISWQSELSDGAAVLAIDVLAGDSARVELDLTSERIPVIWLFTGVPDANDGGNLHFRAQLNSQGASTTDLAANLDGAVLFRGGSGRINSAKLDTIFGDFLYQLSSRAFGTGDQQTRINCTAGAFYIRRGQIQMDPGVAVRTSRFDVLASGQITLPGEKLDLKLTSRSRKGIGVSAANTLIPRVGISGRLSNPQINLSATDTALTGGAAIMSSGLSILATGIWDRIRSSVENPCDALVERARSDGKAYYGNL